jgi:hypothetical protein
MYFSPYGPKHVALIADIIKSLLYLMEMYPVLICHRTTGGIPFKPDFLPSLNEN